MFTTYYYSTDSLAVFWCPTADAPFRNLVSMWEVEGDSLVPYSPIYFGVMQ